MRYQILFVGLVFIIFVPYQYEASNKCFTAKTCLHNAKEFCGEDKNNQPRRFFDTCDMKEYNCLKGTNYVKVSLEHCQNLPRIEEKSTKNIPEKNEEKSKEVKNVEKSQEIDQEKSNEEHSAEKLEKEKISMEEQGAETDVEKIEEKSIEEQDAEKSLEKDEENSRVERDAGSKDVDDAKDVPEVKPEDEKKDQ